MREMDKLHTLYDSLMDARREAGDEVVPFHRFAALVKDQVTKLKSVSGGADRRESELYGEGIEDRGRVGAVREPPLPERTRRRVS